MAKKTNRKIYLIGEINSELYKKFTLKMSRYERESNLPIEIELNSEGGSAYDALAFFDRIKASPCDVIVKGYGLIASAAVIILAAGDKRYMGSSAWVMVHEDSGSIESTVTDMEKYSKHMRRLENQWSLLLADVTKCTLRQWDMYHKQTTYLTATECKTLGLIEEVV